MNSKYPYLFNDMLWSWGPMQVKFTILENLPSPAQIAHVNVVPYLDNKWVMVQLDDGSWEIPGGTLEADEIYIEALKRELLEEV
jgi:8-oxo-dGTP diphosphatase